MTARPQQEHDRPERCAPHDYTDEPPLKQRSEGQEFVSAKHAAHVEEEESLYVHRVHREADRDRALDSHQEEKCQEQGGEVSWPEP